VGVMGEGHVGVMWGGHEGGHVNKTEVGNIIMMRRTRQDMGTSDDIRLPTYPPDHTQYQRYIRLGLFIKHAKTLVSTTTPSARAGAGGWGQER
jgi:hypothetical protein